MGFQVGGHDTEEPVSEINVTPLVDVMLVLLVVFIVTAPLLSNAVKVNLPKTATTAPVEPSRPINVTVNADGKVFIDRDEVAPAALEGELRARKAGTPELALHLRADESVNYGIVAKVMTAVERAGVAKLSVITATE